ncbi:MAG: phosphate acyltransferase [Gemmatimonadaceae bacterium]|nr:phosphate acyltransferase [Gemmatimonadaceae bacterium]
MARIALDAMGGDFAPKAPIAGALLALQELDETNVVQLVGRTAVIESQLKELLSGELASAAGVRKRVQIVEAPDVIEMSEKPTAGLRKKPNSSMVVGLRMQVDDLSDAFVSAGNTGAQMATSAMLLKLQPGLTRPAIATVFPTARNPVIVLDSGANVDCSTRELLQFAWLGAVYAQCIFGRSNPSIGLLSIGEEPEKGNAVVKEAHALFKKAGFNFHGNLEGRDLPAGASDRGPFDVVICDGFVGNVVLKFYEAVAPMIVRLLGEHPGIDPDDVRSALKGFDSSEYGGAPLLGVRGVSIICHGNSSPRAIKNAIKVAVRAVDTGMNDQIGARLESAAPSINAAEKLA